PPGKKSGRTTKESVLKARRGPLAPLFWPSSETVAWSSRAASTSLPKPGTKTRWMRSAVSRPPLPWPSRMWSCGDRGSGQLPNGLAELVASGAFMSDHVLLAPDDMDQVPQDVQQGLVGLLNAVDAEAGHGEAPVAELGHAPPVAAGEAHGDHAEP